MKHVRYLLLVLCLALTACGPKSAGDPPEASVSKPDISAPAVSQPGPDVPEPDVSQPEGPPVTGPSVPFTEEELDQARQAALDYYAGTVFEVTELVFEEQMENTVSFTVKCSKGGVPVDPDRTITLERQEGVWTTVDEGY